jgi:hypothetical protein
LVGLAIGVPVMMGPDRLSTIRRELREHFSEDGSDPIERLNRLKDKAPAARELIELLQRFLEGPQKPRRRPKEARTAKKR